MPAHIPRSCHSVLQLGVIWPLVLIAAASVVARADEPPGKDIPSATEPAKPAKPAEALAGNLVRVQPDEDRKDEKDLLSSIDLAKDVVYTTAESPVPESEQFQFIDGVLRTPEKGDARLVLPIEVPEFYRLSLGLIRKDESADPPIGIGAVMDGHQFFAEMRTAQLTFGRFYDREITKPLASRSQDLPEKMEPQEVAEVLVGDFGILFRHRSVFAEWMTSGKALSLDEKWQVPATGKIFLAFPDGQFDVRSVTLEPLTREAWIEQVTKLLPDRLIAWAGANPDAAKVTADVDPLPRLDALRPTIQMRAQLGDFDELERWAERFRGGEVVVDSQFVSESLYNRLARIYVEPSGGGAGNNTSLDGYYQTQFAFIDGWLKAKPDSVAARIVKAHNYLDYAWEARGCNFANEVPVDAWKPFQERLQIAEAALDEAADLAPPDACVFSTSLIVGRALGWGRAKMEDTVERGLAISTKDFNLFEKMVEHLLPRWGGAPGDLGDFALRMSERLGGNDGLEAYAYIAWVTQSWESKVDEKLAQSPFHRDFTDPKVVLEEFSADKLRAAIPVVLRRRATWPRAKNYVCWLYCVLDDKESAKDLFPSIVSQPDLYIWGSRQNFDQWRHWVDPSFVVPSQFLTLEGEEIAHLQAYSSGASEITFLPDNQTLVTGSPTPDSKIKFWDLSQKIISTQIDPAFEGGNLLDIWLQDNGDLILPMRYRKGLFMVLYAPPDYQKNVQYPALFSGEPYHLISRDSLVAATFEGGQVTFRDSRQQKQKVFSVPTMPTVRISPDGKYLLGGDDKIHLWDGLAGSEVFNIDVRPKLLYFTRDGSGIIFTTPGELAVWDIDGRRQRFSVPLGAQRTVQAIQSTLDGRFLATGERRTDGGGVRHVIALYDLESSKPVHLFDGHKTPIGDLAISRDGNRLASGSADGVVKVWDLAAAILAPQPAKPDQPMDGSTSVPPAKAVSGTTLSMWRIGAAMGLVVVLGALVVYRSSRRGSPAQA